MPALKSLNNLLKPIAIKRTTNTGIANTKVAKETKNNSALDVYNWDRQQDVNYRANWYGDITPYINAAQRAQASADSFNAAEAEKNRVWQAEMSSTAHQREVADLKAAGLNPIISAYGQGAATGSGATASSTNALTGVLGNMAMSAMQAVTSLSNTMLNNSTARVNAVQVNQTNKEITRMNNETQVYITRLNNMTQKEVAHISGQYHLNSAEVSAYASRYSSDMAYLAAQYSANKSYQATMDSKPAEKLIQEARDYFDLTYENATNVVSEFLNWLVPKAY